MPSRTRDVNWAMRTALRKDNQMLERIKEMTGIYSLGFDKASFIGIMLPILFVVVVGGGLGVLVVIM